MTTFYHAMEKRRSYYELTKEEVVSDERIEEVLKHALKYAPSAFNSQSDRLLLLLDKEHDRLWDKTIDMLKKEKDDFPEEEAARIKQLKAGYGTVLFFTDQMAIAEGQRKHPKYLEYFSNWAEQSSGMIQFIVWTSLQVEGFGASLHHYHPYIESFVKEEWNLSEHWHLRAQLPFGKALDVADEHQHKYRVDEKLKWFE